MRQARNPVKPGARRSDRARSERYVRFLTQDDPTQSGTAIHIFEHVLSERKAGFISIVAMVETVWVVERAYSFGAGAIASAVEVLLAIDVVSIQFEQQVFAAMLQLKSNRGSFADALIGELGAEAGCSRTVTFDRRAPRMNGFAPP